MTFRRALRNAVVAADAVLLVTHDYACTRDRARRHRLADDALESQ
jgi:hypothetical protein